MLSLSDYYGLFVNQACDFPDGQWPIILADPPWSYTGQQDKWAAAAKFYSLMSQDEIAALPVNSLLDNPGVLFLWATGPMLHHAIEVIEKWGLYYRGVGFVWVKTTRLGVPIGAQGVRPSVIKPLTEFVLVASNKPTGRPLPLADEGVVQTVFATKQEHSVKPQEVYERIERLYPHQRKIELFARSRRNGWDAWGDELVERT